MTSKTLSDLKFNLFWEAYGDVRLKTSPLSIKILARLLFYHFNPDHGCFPSNATIAREAHATKGAVIDCIKLIERCGYLNKQNRFNTSNMLCFNWENKATNTPLNLEIEGVEEVDNGWVARYRNKLLGTFDTVEEAIAHRENYKKAMERGSSKSQDRLPKGRFKRPEEDGAEVGLDDPDVGLNDLEVGLDDPTGRIRRPQGSAEPHPIQLRESINDSNNDSFKMISPQEAASIGSEDISFKEKEMDSSSVQNKEIDYIKKLRLLADRDSNPHVSNEAASSSHISPKGPGSDSKLHNETPAIPNFIKQLKGVMTPKTNLKAHGEVSDPSGNKMQANETVSPARVSGSLRTSSNETENAAAKAVAKVAEIRASIAAIKMRTVTAEEADAGFEQLWIKHPYGSKNAARHYYDLRMKYGYVPSIIIEGVEGYCGPLEDYLQLN